MISVVMAVYNESPNELKLAIESILNQDYERFELIIVLDNPNNYQAKNIIAGYGKIDSRIRLIVNEENIGLGASLNTAIEYSTSDLIARMDADDIALPTRLSTLIRHLESKDDILFSRYEVIDRFGKHIKYSRHMDYTQVQIRIKLLLNNFICHPSVMFRKSAYVRAGGYSDIRVSEDIDLWIRMSKLKMHFHGVDEILVQYRIRDDSMTTSNYFRTHFAKKCIRKEYRHWDFTSKITNYKFSKAMNRSKVNISDYNRDAKKIESAINNLTTLKINRILIASYSALKHPLLLSILRDRLLSQLIRPIAHSQVAKEQ